MPWNPLEARKLLDSSLLVKYIDETEKLVSYRMESGRELALIKENISRVSIYVSQYPHHMPEINFDEEYKPTKKKGRHSNLESITCTLGFEHKAFKLQVVSKRGFEYFLEWYQYA